MKRMGMVLLAAVALAPTGLTGQARTIEIGADAAFGVYNTAGVQSNVTSLAFPLNRLRVGVSLGTRFGLESTLRFTRASSGGHSGHELDLGPSLTFRLKNGDGITPYLRAGARLNRATQNVLTDTQTGLSAGLGLRVPISDHAATRVELGAERSFETDHRARVDWIGVTVGLTLRVR